MATKRPPRLNVEIEDEALLRAVRHVAIDCHLSLKDVVDRALRLWLEDRENEEDLRAMAEAEAEGGEAIPWEQYKAEMLMVDKAERAN